jgi:hypothetical protein
VRRTATKYGGVLLTNRSSSRKEVFTRVLGTLVRTSMTYRLGLRSRMVRMIDVRFISPTPERHHGLEVAAVDHGGDVRQVVGTTRRPVGAVPGVGVGLDVGHADRQEGVSRNPDGKT